MRGMNGMESLGVDANQALSDVLKAVPSLTQGFVQSYNAVTGKTTYVPKPEPSPTVPASTTNWSQILIYGGLGLLAVVAVMKLTKKSS
jgi:hypothetical protein